VPTFFQGNADIFFPTDFQLLERLDHYAATGSAEMDTSDRISTVVRIWQDIAKSSYIIYSWLSKFAHTGVSLMVMVLQVTSAEFMEQCAQVDKTKTLDGFNPLLEDYSNTKFYISLPSLPSLYSYHI
jgi:hypothetical protein